MIASVIVTAPAIRDRAQRRRFDRSELFQSSLKLSSVQLWIVSEVNGSTVQNDETNSAISAAM